MSEPCAIETTEMLQTAVGKGLGGSESVAVGMLGLWEGFRDTRSFLCSNSTLDRKLWVKKQLVNFVPHHVNSTYKAPFCPLLFWSRGKRCKN